MAVADEHPEGSHSDDRGWPTVVQSPCAMILGSTRTDLGQPDMDTAQPRVQPSPSRFAAYMYVPPPDSFSAYRQIPNMSGFHVYLFSKR